MISHLRVMIFLSAYLQYFKSEALLPQDAVTLSNLRVDDQGMASVDIAIEDVDHALNKNDLEVVLTDSFTDTAMLIPLPSARQNSTNFISATLSGLEQDVKYSLDIQVNGSVTTSRYTLVTAGLQSTSFNTANSLVSCEFLPRSRADGCIVEWSPANLFGEDGRYIVGEDGRYIVLPRDQDENEAIAQLPSLLPGMSYQVRGFGLLDGKRLHTFPITLPGDFILSTSASLGSTGDSAMITEPSRENNMLLVITLSAVLSVILATIIVLICIIVAAVKCPRKSHAKMPENAEQELPSGENIQTLTNICYGDIFETSVTPTESDKKRDSLHLYDDVIALAASQNNNYENVDTETGLPVVPKPSNSPSEGTVTPMCERACLPLRGITPSAASPNLHKPAKVKKSQRSLERAQTFQHKSLRSPMTQAKFATLSVVLEAADYEMPTPCVKSTVV